jgi:SAM-dependent methyltransferase
LRREAVSALKELLEKKGKSKRNPKAFFEYVLRRTITRIVTGKFGLMDQYRSPTGRPGRLVAKLMNREHEPLTLWGLTTVGIASNDVILDVGCGGGKTVNRLAQRVPKGRVVGIDNSAEMVKYSKKLNKKLIAQNRVQIIEGPVEKMSLPKDYFDLVTAFETYYFWSNFHDALEEIKRVLKPSGKLLLVNEMVQDGMYEIKHAKLIDETHVRLFPLEEIRNAMRSVGFVSIQIFVKPESPWNAILAQKHSI